VRCCGINEFLNHLFCWCFWEVKISQSRCINRKDGSRTRWYRSTSLARQDEGQSHTPSVLPSCHPQ
jgi:hypothetical protein